MLEETGSGKVLTMPVMARYAVATLTPLAFILLGAILWGGFAVAALLWLTLLAAGLDQILSRPERDTADHSPWPDRLSVALGVGHLIALPVVLVALAGSGLGLGGKVVLFFATASFFGQVSHPNAHELIHRKPKALRVLGAAVYTSVGFGHHVSAHRLVHHRFVGTPDDPNTPLPGENFWAYLPRAWEGSFRAGLSCEEDRLARRDLPPRHPLNPYYAWVGGAVLSFILAVWVAGPVGGLGLIALGALTGTQILMSDYIQHYGLQRLERADGRLEPVGAHHSWNAPHGFSSYLMLNAPSHSEHHMHPDTAYDHLDPEAKVPTLPFAMPVMAMLATIPSVWHRLMDRRAVKVMTAAQDRLNTAPRRPSADTAPIRPTRSDRSSQTDPMDPTDAMISRVVNAID